MKKFKYFLLTGMLLAAIGLSGCGKKAEDDITNKEVFEDDLQPLTEDELNAMDADTSDDDMKAIDDPDDAEDVENTDNDNQKLFELKNNQEAFCLLVSFCSLYDLPTQQMLDISVRSKYRHLQKKRIGIFPALPLHRHA